MHICKYCNKEFTTGQKMGGHVTKCNKNPNKQVIIRNKQPKIIYNINCVVCNKSFDVSCTNSNFIKGKYRKTCSAACAKQLTVINTDLLVRNKNISNSLKTNYIPREHIKRDRFCEYCGIIK